MPLSQVYERELKAADFLISGQQTITVYSQISEKLDFSFSLAAGLLAALPQLCGSPGEAEAQQCKRGRFGRIGYR
jgi:hypothetical protein